MKDSLSELEIEQQIYKLVVNKSENKAYDTIFWNPTNLFYIILTNQINLKYRKEIFRYFFHVAPTILWTLTSV